MLISGLKTAVLLTANFQFSFGVSNFEFKTGNIHNLLEHFENRLIFIIKTRFMFVCFCVCLFVRLVIKY